MRTTALLIVALACRDSATGAVSSAPPSTPTEAAADAALASQPGARSSTTYEAVPHAIDQVLDDSSQPLGVEGAFAELPVCAKPLPAGNPDGSPFRSYSQALQELPDCHSSAHTLGSDLRRGACTDGKRFLAQHDTFEGEGKTRFYRGEMLVGIARASYLGGAMCGAGVEGDVICQVAKIESFCGGN